MTLELLWAAPSPFVRKVRVVAAEIGTTLTLTEVFASPLERRDQVCDANPLGKIPALRLPDGQVLYDSRVICRYLGAGSAIYPAGAAEWSALRREALADGLLEAALLARYETVLRPTEYRWDGWLNGQMAKIAAALVQMGRDRPDAATPDIGDIAAGCALGYLNLRYPDMDWQAEHPVLATFYEQISQRPSFRATVHG